MSSNEVDRWLNSGRYASIEGIDLLPRENPLLKGSPLVTSMGQAEVYYLNDRNNREWILKKFLPGRSPNSQYIKAIQALIPQEPGFESGYQRRILGRMSLSGSGYYSAEFTQWIENTILMPKIKGYGWAALADKVREGHTSLTSYQRLLLCKNLSEKILSLEKREIAHRDLSSTNIFIDPTSWEVHLIDWDSIYHNTLIMPANTTFGTNGYIAPFVKVNGAEDSRVTWRPRSDRFSLAVMNVEFLSIQKDSPFTGDGGMFEQDEIYNQSGKGIATIIGNLQRSFPNAVGLFDKTFWARNFEDCPSPQEWMTFSGDVTRIPTPPKAVTATTPRPTVPVPSKVTPPTPTAAFRNATLMITGFLIITVSIFFFVRMFWNSAPLNTSNDNRAIHNTNGTSQGPETIGGQQGNVGSPEGDQTLNSNIENANIPDQGQVATLIISTNVDGVLVSVDGVSRGRISLGQPISVSLSPGQHVVRATKQDYATWETRYNLSADERENVQILMNPSQAGTLKEESTQVGPSQTETVQAGPSPQEIASGYRSRAENLFQQGKIDDALSEAEMGLRYDPGNSSLQTLKGKLERARSILNRQSSMPTGSQAAAAPQSPVQQRAENPSGANRGAILISSPSPVYPESARSARISGTVWVEVTIDERGNVSSARAISGPSQLYQAAVNAARQSKFRPAQLNGQPTSDRKKLPFMFNPRSL